MSARPACSQPSEPDVNRAPGQPDAPVRGAANRVLAGSAYEGHDGDHRRE
jgi:hypothetical protein